MLLSSVIEITQLVSCRGLFEWDDMLHNGIGCMLGCLLADLVIRVRIVLLPDKESFIVKFAIFH